MMTSIALVFAVLLQFCTFTAQQDVPDVGSAPFVEASGSTPFVEASGSTPFSRPCHEAGYSRCCRGRNDSCLGKPGVCYCDEYCLRTNTGDCCEDLVMGMLRCDVSSPGCADTLEERVRGLAEIQTVLAETYVGLPDHFPTAQIYLQNLMRQVTNNLFNPFDGNNNDQLDRHEFHLLYQGILSDTNTNLMICEEDFLNFCDTSGDEKVTEGELELCTGVVPYCDTKDDTATLLASELLVSQLQPVFSDTIARDQFGNSVFPFSDRENPRGLLDINEFQMLYARMIELYNVLPSVCPESVFELCNTDGDQFVSLDEVYVCGGSKA